ncbi:MAG: amino acid permease [Ferruginibacter sp.]|nr:amino acid permease [Ferruginibacter sp.]
MQSQPNFKRTLGLYTAISLVIGTVIGSGIFMRPAEMASLLGSPILILVVWVIGGLLSLFVAMVIAEVGAMLPETGGQYFFMRKMYGEFWAYLYGWANFSVINTAGTAGIAFICSQYVEYFFKLPRFSQTIEQSFKIHLPFIGDILPLENIGVKCLTILLLIILTIISYRSTKTGGIIQVVFTAAKVLAIVLLIGGLFFYKDGGVKNFATSPTLVKPIGFALFTAMIAACNGALQAYDGWGTMVNIAGEIKNPQKNIPKSLFIGLLSCIAIYIIITLAIMYVLPIDEMAKSSLVASDAAAKVFGNIGGGIIAFLICLSVLGVTNASILAPPRMTFAMAQEGKFFGFAGKIHPKYNTPGNAMLLHLGWMIVMVFSGSFYILADMYIFVTWLFNLMLVAGVFILRKKMPNAVRPYRVWGYPIIPIVALLCTTLYLCVTLYNDVAAYNSGKTNLINSVFGIALTAIGIPFYFYFKKKYKA